MRRAGFTLVEALVALAIVGLLFVALSGYLRSARSAWLAAETASEASVTLQLATELLREELLLAGSGPWPLPAAEGAVTGLEAGQTAAQFLDQGLRLLVSPGGTALRVVYIDDRITGAPVARQLTFEAAPDGQGQPQLYRRSGASARQPWVAGVERLVVSGVIDVHGNTYSAAAAPGHPLRALWLELEAHGETAVALLELPHRPMAVGP